MNPAVPIAALAGFALLVALSRSGSGTVVSGSWCDMEKDDVRANAKAVAQTLSSKYGIAGLPTFLDAVGYWESRWSPCVAGDGGASKGLYQMQANSVFRDSTGLSKLKPQWSKLSQDGKLSVILATDYAMQAGRRMRDEGSEAYWLGVRRWWKYPSLVHDHDESSSTSVGIRTRFTEALEAVGVNPNFMMSTFNPSNWPGAKQVMLEQGYASLVK